MLRERERVRERVGEERGIELGDSPLPFFSSRFSSLLVFSSSPLLVSSGVLHSQREQVMEDVREACAGLYGSTRSVALVGTLGERRPGEMRVDERGRGMRAGAWIWEGIVVGLTADERRG